MKNENIMGLQKSDSFYWNKIECFC